MAHTNGGSEPDCVTWGLAVGDLLYFQADQGSALAGAALLAGDLASRAFGVSRDVAESIAQQAEPFVLSFRGVAKAVEIVAGRN